MKAIVGVVGQRLTVNAMVVSLVDTARRLVPLFNKKKKCGTECLKIWFPVSSGYMGKTSSYKKRNNECYE